MNPEKADKKFNVTLTTAFQAPKFGTGSLISSALRQDEIDSFQKLKPGDKVLIRKSNRKTSRDEEYFFLEILPPREGYVTSPTSDSDV